MLEFSQHCLFRRMYTVFRYSARNLYKCSAVAEMGDRLARIDMGRKGGLLYHFQGGAGSPSNTMWPWLRPTSVPSALLIHPAVWPQQTWAENWGGCPFLGELGLQPTQLQCGGGRGLPSCRFILIHPTIWPQYTNVTDRQDRSDSVGRTVLQTVAQNVPNKSDFR